MVNSGGEYWLINGTEQKKALLRYVENRNEVKPFEVRFSDTVEPVGERQKRYLIGWVYGVILNHLNANGITIPLDGNTQIPYDKEMLHDIFKREFMQVGALNAVRKDGTFVTLPLYRAVTEMTPTDYFALIEKIEGWVLRRWGLFLASPTGGTWGALYAGLSECQE